MSNSTQIETVPSGLPTNPMAVGMRQTRQQIGGLDFRRSGFLPALIALCVLVLVYLFFFLLWPYGLVVVVRDLLVRMVKEAVAEITNQQSSVPLQSFVPLQQVVTIGVYSCIWMPFAAASLPLVLIGLVGRLISAIHADMNL